MACIYGYYKKEETYYPRLYCKLTDKSCRYSKKCLKEERFIPLDNQGECYLYNMEKKKKIPNGSNYVRFEHKGYLFIEVDDNRTIKVKNTLGKVEDYVYLRKVGNDYEISLSPFPTEIKKEDKEPKVEKVEKVEIEKEKTTTTKSKKKKSNNNYVKKED